MPQQQSLIEIRDSELAQLREELAEGQGRIMEFGDRDGAAEACSRLTSLYHRDVAAPKP